MRFIDLFAGIGGFHYAIEKAYCRMAHKAGQMGSISSGQKEVHSSGMGGSSTERDLHRIEQPTPTCVYANEWDKYANSVYRRHYGECDQSDIRTVDARSIPDHDILCGGFPCQAFSIAGKRRGFEDTRGTLFFDIARILREKRPRYSVLENVKGLLSHDGGRTFKTIIATLVELGYDVQWQVCNSKDFGVPQNRERVIIVGHLGGTPRPKVFPITSSYGEITKEQSANAIVTSYWKGCDYHGQRTQIAYEDKVARRTIRRLTPIECERLQGFPDDWTKYDAEGKVVSDTQRYKMCGNAVTTNVIQAVMEKLIGESHGTEYGNP